MAITPNQIFEGSYGFQIVFEISKPIDLASIYKLYILGPSPDITTNYTFVSGTDYQDVSGGVLAYTTQVMDFPIKGSYKLQISEETLTPPMRIFSSVMVIPVHDAIPVE